jgi:hypothetical protein
MNPDSLRVRVQLFGPYSFTGCQDDNVFINPLGKKKGFYLLTIPFDDKYLVYYAGETGVSFAQRKLQHVQSYLNGFYRVFNPKEFVRGRKVLVWGGMWKTDRRDPKLMSEFLERHSELAPKILKFIEQFRVFLAPIEADKRIRERLESEIARSLNVQEGIVSSFQDKDVRYDARRAKESPLKIAMSFPECIMGMEAELIV